MEKQNKNQFIVLTILGILVLIVVSFTVFSIVRYQKPTGDERRIVFNQIYSSDYKIKVLDNDYFIGSYNDNYIDVIIDKTGREIIKSAGDIYYENIYKMKDGRYLIYNNNNNSLNVYVFDRSDIKSYFSLKNVLYAKPLIYRGDAYDYIVGFYNILENDLYIYKIDGTGTTIVKDATIQAAESKNGIYYVNSEKYLIIRDEEGTKKVIDYDGNIIIEGDYKDIISTKDDAFIALNNKDKFGIIDKNGEELLKFNNKVIKNFNEFFLVVNNNNKIAILDSEYNNLTGYVMDYDTLLNYDLRNKDSLYFTKFNGNILVANNYREDTDGIEYTKHSLYIINNDKIWQKIEQKGFFMDTLLFVYDSNYNITIYDENYDVIGNISLDNVSKIENIRYIYGKIVLIDYIDIEHNLVTKYYDINGNDITNNFNSLGKLVENNYLYHAFLSDDGSNKTLLVYDAKHELSNTINGSNIELNEEYIIVDNAIYKIEITE